eukprot:c18573_g1_i5.p1 GENE.c18573_g1_i5~~c18573_g1_i5.p1  ORF type:complete len:333 (+),score=53.90 c18573_g1_i5:714-1712(+)
MRDAPHERLTSTTTIFLAFVWCADLFEKILNPSFDAAMAGVLFLGSGSSGGTPLVRCILQDDIDCKVCQDALIPGSMNERGNPSILIRVQSTNILVDCGKTFTNAAIKFLPPLGIKKIAGVVLTHAHADAVAGLDNLREIQLLEQDPTEWSVRECMPLYAAENTIQTVREQMAYILSDPSDPVPAGCVTRCWHRPISRFVPFEIDGFEILPLPVWHGPGYESLGFAFGNRHRVVYLSDVSEVPEETLQVIMSRTVDLLVVDSLTWDIPRLSHFCVLQALDLIRKIRPKKALLVGCSCAMEHHETNARLRALLEPEGLDVQLAHDGLFVPLEL